MAKNLFKAAKTTGKNNTLPKKRTSVKDKKRTSTKEKTYEEASGSVKKTFRLKAVKEKPGSLNKEKGKVSVRKPKLKLNNPKNDVAASKKKALAKGKVISDKKIKPKTKKGVTASNKAKKMIRPKQKAMKKAGWSGGLGITRQMLPKTNFKFKMIKKPILATTTVGLSGGGTIKMEFGRNMQAVSKFTSKGKPAETEGNWTCSVNSVSAEIINRDNAILNPQFHKLFVGGVYDINNIVNGKYNEVPFTRKPFTLVNFNSEAKNAITEVKSPPDSGKVQQAIQDLTYGIKISSAGKGISNKFEMASLESFFMKTGGSGYYLGFGGNADFDFKSKTKTHKYVLQFSQVYYTISVGSLKEPKDFFYLTSEGNEAGAIDQNKIDPNWVYIDSVSYGRLLYVVFESKYDLTEYGFSADVYADFGVLGAEAHYDDRQLKIMESISYQIGFVGGDAKAVGKLLGANSLKELKKRIDAYFQNTSGAEKIAFTLATLDQATVGTRMITAYTSRQCGPITNKFRVTWLTVQNTKNDDSGSAGEFRTTVRIKAIGGNGKSVMDVDKRNKALAEWEKLPKHAKKLVAPPWTFTKGTGNNPLELKEGESWKANKVIEFELPKDDKNAKIAIRVDAVEYDDFDNDKYDENTWQKKISEITTVTPVVLVTNEGAGRVTFILQVEPIY